MPTLESPCFLLPHGCERSTVYVCVPVDRDLASKSPVLETLMEFEGLVDMPEGVSLEDFEAWSTIVMRQPSTLSLDELSFALQVGEKLSAHNTSKLTEVLAARLKATSWSSHTDPGSMLRALLPLNKNLQQLVFRQAYADWWLSPTPGYPERPFTITKDEPPATVLSLLDLLSRTDPSLPGLTSLAVKCDIATAAAASRLSATLLHHPAIAKLDMPRLSWALCGPSPPAATVFRTLPQLTAITCLTLSAPSLPLARPKPVTAEAAVQAVQAMAAAISALPSLSQFRLATMDTSATSTSAAKPRPPAPKRRKVVSSMGSAWTAIKQPSLDAVILALSAAPALTDLTLSIPAGSHGNALASTGPFSSLRNLKYELSAIDEGAWREGDNGDAAAVLSSVPLPALTSLHYKSTSPECEDHSACIQSILANATSQPALQHVHIQLTPDNCCNGVCLSVHDTAADSELEVDVAPCLTKSVAHALSAGLQRLTARDLLYISLGNEERAVSDGQVLQGVEHVQPILQSLSAFTCLRRLMLDVHLVPSLYGEQVHDLCSSFLAAPLPSITHLTLLHLDMPIECGLQLSRMSGHLAEMRQLQDMILSDFECAGVHDFEMCFAQLTALTRFWVCVRPITADLMRSFAGFAKRMPDLDVSVLASPSYWEDDDAENEENDDIVHGCWDSWCEGYLQMPCRGYHEVPCSKLATETEVDALKQRFAAQGATVAKFSNSLTLDFRTGSKAASTQQ